MRMAADCTLLAQLVRILVSCCVVGMDDGKDLTTQFVTLNTHHIPPHALFTFKFLSLQIECHCHNHFALPVLRESIE